MGLQDVPRQETEAEPQGPEHTPLPPTGNQTSELQLVMAEPAALTYPLNLHQNPLKTEFLFHR